MPLTARSGWLQHGGAMSEAVAQKHDKPTGQWPVWPAVVAHPAKLPHAAPSTTTAESAWFARCIQPFSSIITTLNGCRGRRLGRTFHGARQAPEQAVHELVYGADPTGTMSTTAHGSLMVMPSYNMVIALPTADRSRAHAFARALGLETPGEAAEDGIPEPLRVQLNEHASVMYVPTGGFGWITDGRTTAESGTSECLLSLQVGTPSEVDDLVGHVDAAGGRVVSGPEQKAWGYTGSFADSDGHLWEAIVSAI